MKKIFTLLAVMMLVFVSANAQSRKTWDFTKGVSDESRAMLDADAAQWTKTMNSDGTATATWATINAVEGELTAGGVVIPEFAGLQFKQFAAGNAVLYRGNCLRLQKNCAFDLPALTAGQTIVIKAQSANATATDRGLGFSNANIVEGPDDGICLGSAVEGAPEGGVTTFKLVVASDGVVTVSTGVNGAKASGVEILSIIIDEGDKNIKKWDFSNWSEATVAQVCAAEDWTTAESDAKNYITGNEIRWIAGDPIMDANLDLTAGGEAIKELKGLRHSGLGKYGYGIAFDYQTTTDGNNWGPYNAGSYLWVMTANSTITIPNVKAGSTLKIASESHKPSEARGFNVTVGGAAVASATGSSTSTAYTVFEYTIPTGDEEFVDVVLKATKGCHLYSIEAEVKDEAVVDKNPKLGNPKFDGLPKGKVNPETATGFTMTFPNAANVDLQTKVTVEGYFGPAELEEGESAEDYMFDGLEGTVGQGINFTYSDYLELEENKEYEIYFTKIIVDGFDALNKEAAEGEKLYGATFQTSGEGIAEAREWKFETTQEQADQLAAATKYWASSSKGRYSYANPMTYSQLMLDDETPFSITEGLYFSMGTANDILIGTPAGNNGKLQLGGGTPSITIPQCSAGDEITIKALWSTKNSGIITITNGTAEDGSNVINLSGSSAEYKITVTENSDVVLASKNVVYQEISIFPASIEKQDINYTIAAADAEGNPVKTLAEGTGVTNDNITAFYPYYIMDAEGNIFTNGAKGSPFSTSVTLENDKELYTINYKQANIEGFVKGVFCAEAEDLTDVAVTEAGNMGIRASMGKCAYCTSDVELCTLEPGTYQIKAMIWDTNKGGGVTMVSFSCGEQKIDIMSNGDNMSEATSEAITVAEPTKLVWMAGGEDGHCLDAILVYEYSVADAISNVTSNAIAVKAQKVIENGNLVIKTAKGTFSVSGAQMK